MHHREATRRAAGLCAIVAAALFALVLLLAGFSSGQPARAAERPNVILIIVDAVRADHLSAYGYARPTTPNLDTLLAAEGTLFTDATSASAWTFPANTAMLTGRAPSRIGIDYHNNSSRIPDRETMLAEHLHDAGYRTAGFINTFYVYSRFGFDQGFDHYEDIKVPAVAEEASQVNDALAAWLDANWTPAPAGTPLFLYLYYRDPHTPYTPPPPYDILYDATYTGTLTGEAYGHGKDVVAGTVVPTERDIEHLQAIYDGELTYWDMRFGELMADLEARGLLENTIIALTSDHGQMFGEHGLWTHHNSLLEEVLRVPLAISWPGVLTPSQVITAPVSTMDVTPTLLELLGLPVPPGLDAVSLAPALRGEAVPAKRTIYAEQDGVTDPTSNHYWISPRHDLRSMKWDNWKYILQVDNQADDALYQLQPGSLYEPENLIASEPERAAAYYSNIYDWFNLPTSFNFLPNVLHQGAAGSN
jgi:arylsulfatase